MSVESGDSVDHRVGAEDCEMTGVLLKEAKPGVAEGWLKDGMPVREGMGAFDTVPLRVGTPMDLVALGEEQGVGLPVPPALLAVPMDTLGLLEAVRVTEGVTEGERLTVGVRETNGEREGEEEREGLLGVLGADPDLDPLGHPLGVEDTEGEDDRDAVRMLVREGVEEVEGVRSGVPLGMEALAALEGVTEGEGEREGEGLAE